MVVKKNPFELPQNPLTEAIQKNMPKELPKLDTSQAGIGNTKPLINSAPLSESFKTEFLKMNNPAMLENKTELPPAPDRRNFTGEGGQRQVLHYINGKPFLMSWSDYQKEVKAGNVSPEEQKAISGDIQVQQDRQMLEQRFNQLNPILNTIGNVTNSPDANISPAGFGDVKGDLLAGAGLAGTGALIGKAGTGALAGAGVAGGIATGVGAIPLAIMATSAIMNIRSELKEERGEQVGAEFTRAKGYINKIIPSIIKNAKNADVSETIQAYNEAVIAVYRAESNLKLLDEASWVKAKKELAWIETFRRMKPTYDKMLADAILKNPNADIDTSQLESFGQGTEVTNA